jgi:uncharacterized protein (DUF58 family)
MELKDIFRLSQIDSLKALQLFSKHLVNTLQIGEHHSIRKGGGIEFKEYRNYAPGDSLKQLDWKYYARTDHYMIKEAEVERMQEFLFVLDRSASMLFQKDEMSKLNYAKAFIASLAYIAQNQNDDYAVYAVAKEHSSYEEFLNNLLLLESADQVDLIEMMPQKVRNKKSISFILSDGYLDKQSLNSLLKNWSLAAHEVVFIHMLFDQELKLNFDNKQHCFKDLETGEVVEVNTLSQRQAYQERVNTWLSEVKDSCKQYQVFYHAFDGTEEMRISIFNLLAHINK